MNKTINSLNTSRHIKPFNHKKKLSYTNSYMNKSNFNTLSDIQFKYNKLRISLPMKAKESKLLSPKLLKKTLNSQIPPSSIEQKDHHLPFNNNSIYYSKHKNKTVFISDYLNTEFKLYEDKENQSNNYQNKDKQTIVNSSLYTEVKNGKSIENKTIPTSFKKLLKFQNNNTFKFSLYRQKNNLYENSKNNNDINKNNKILKICSLSPKYNNNAFKEDKNNSLNHNNIKKNKTIFYAQKKELSKNISPKKILLLNSQKIKEKTKSRFPNYNKTVKNIGCINKKVSVPKIICPNEFQIIKQIGYGSFGKIFETEWNKNNKKYAMKIMFTKNREDILYLKEKVNLIIDFQEKTKCDGLIRIYGDSYCKKENDYKYYEIMELAERDWEKEINIRKKEMKCYFEWELFNIMSQLVKTLSLLQKNQITHRDIKIQNILIINNQYKICDFGEARKLTQKGIIVQPPRGSELYMSPIQFYGLNQKCKLVQHNTYKSDVFSLGMCILYAAGLGCNCLCDIRELTDMNNIRNILEYYLSKRYSNGFIKLLLCFLEINEKKRPDFIQLENIISQIK